MFSLISLSSDCFSHIFMKKMRFINRLLVCSHFQLRGLGKRKKMLISQFNSLQRFVRRNTVGKSSPSRSFFKENSM